MITQLFACEPVPVEALTSSNDEIREEALEGLSARQARQVVPLLEEAAWENDYSLRVSALAALVLADPFEAEQVLRRGLADEEVRTWVISALAGRQTKRSCDLLAEVWVATVPAERKELGSVLTDARLDDGWPCFQSLKPYTTTHPEAATLWEIGLRQLAGY